MKETKKKKKKMVLRHKQSDDVTIINRKRLVILFGVFALVLFILCLRIGYIQLVKGTELEKKAVSQQTKDELLEPKRGMIVDRNGQELAVSTASFTVWARPSEVLVGKTNSDKEKNADEVASKLAKHLETEEKEIRKIITNDKKSYIKIEKYLPRDKADKIRKEGLDGISLTEDVKRYYPMGNFASQLLGSVTDDNVGLSGIERQYNNKLTGVDGRWVKNTDVRGNPLAYGTEKYYEPKDGKNVVLTIDQVIQSYAEKSIKTVKKDTGAERVSCLVMDPKTGEILAMASNPGFDPNNPREPINAEDKPEFEKMDYKKQFEYLNEMWRNPLVSDIYEPGSTAKLITTAASLEEGITNKKDTFTCTGSKTIMGERVRCWSYKHPHGTQKLYEGVGNSCNPVFMDLALRLGTEKYYDYLELFGLREKTGIDYPGEANSITVPEKSVTSLDLATMGFGQTNAVSAIQLISAVSAIGNDGVVMQPHLVKSFTDNNGDVTEAIKPKKVRQAVSEETADEMCKIMQYVVEKGGGDKAQIKGYAIGGKTGTAQKAGASGYSKNVVASFMGMAPMDDPEFTILYLIDSPKGNAFGGTIAAPAAKGVIEKILKYKDIKPNYNAKETKENKKATITIPKVKGMKLSEATKVLEGMNLRWEVSPKLESKKDVKIVDQYPKAGGKTVKNGIVYLYRK